MPRILSRLPVGVLGLAGILATTSAAIAEDLPFMEYARVDPNKVVTDEACGECHLYEHQVWERSKHATSFKTLHRKEQAETIARKMGFRLIKRDSLCFSCHYTPVVQSGKIKVVSGPSCESCHGAGADWINVHNDYGEDRTFQTETAEHRRARIERSREAGMRRPSDLYPVAANCFSCHTVPLEELVNVGGHSTGTSGFELVERTQGSIRHNFLESSRRGGGAVNVERSMSRKRVMYVVGRALDLEYSLRGMAAARDDGIYSKAMSRRVRSALAEVRAIDRNAEITELGQMIAAVRGVQVVPRNAAALNGAAEKVGAATRRFLARGLSGNDLAGLDPLVSGQGEPDEEVLVAGGEGVAGGAAIAGSAVGGESRSAEATVSRASAGDGPGSAVGTTAAGRSSSAAGGVAGEFKRKIRPASKHRTVGPGSCSGCHAPQNQWWFGHDHYRSADPFFDGAPKNSQIARLYGLSPSQMTRGNQVCMDCHGTVVSGKESREVLDGVGCEACHGPAADWLEPHKDETDKHLGRARPGHKRALQLGKTDLADLRQRALRCTGCHLITEPRLLSAGHPSGAGFDYVRAMQSIEHWDGGSPSAADVEAVFGAVVAERGPVPKVRVAVARSAGVGDSGVSPRVAGGLPAEATSSTGAGGAVSALQQADRNAARAYVEPPRARPLAFSGATGIGGKSAAGAALPPFPEVPDEATIADVMRLVQKRLEMLYRLVSPVGQQVNR